MRYRDNGSLYSINISRREVEDFAARWPCFGPRRAIWAQFDKRDGDLIDLEGDSGMDSGGVIALLQDAQQSPRNPFKLDTLRAWPCDNGTVDFVDTAGEVVIQNFGVQS